MKATDREIANVLERFFYKHIEFLKGEGKLIMPDKKEDEEDYIMELFPTDMDYREYAQEILKEINDIKGRWIV